MEDIVVGFVRVHPAQNRWMIENAHGVTSGARRDLLLAPLPIKFRRPGATFARQIDEALQFPAHVRAKTVGLCQRHQHERDCHQN